MPDANDQLAYLCGGEIDAGEFVLRITSDDLDPAQITKMLGLQPTETNRRGDEFGSRGHKYKFGQWCLSSGRLDFRSGKSCEQAFDDFVRRLPDDPAVWDRINSEDEGQVFIYCWMRTWNREFDISAFALGELARRKLRLHVDTYLEEGDEG
ncbi:MAG TPA: DUF4279 domain-containing protein [Roseimicrobium sp.]|nr:DUF4279 domain-containing protein [Roseimicrobium sp.]